LAAALVVLLEEQLEALSAEAQEAAQEEALSRVEATPTRVAEALSKVEAMIKDKAAKTTRMAKMVGMIGMIGMIGDKYESTNSGQIFLRDLT